MLRSLLIAGCALAGGVFAAVAWAGDGTQRPPAWVKAATQRLITPLESSEGAKLVRVYYITYPDKIAVVIEFDRDVRADR